MTGTLLSTVRARRGHFRMESGHHSDFWMDLETLCRRPAAIRPFAADLAVRLRRYEVDAVCGPLNEGAFVALMVASELDRDFTYAERFVDPASQELFPVDYRLPSPLHPIVHGRRVAIVNDVISAGSAVRGAFADLERIGARVVAIGSLLVLGPSIAAFAREHRIALETLSELPGNLWKPADCPLCVSGVPLESVSA
jgi:orotate phosphoribosyltransferase